MLPSALLEMSLTLLTSETFRLYKRNLSSQRVLSKAAEGLKRCCDAYSTAKLESNNLSSKK